MHKYTHVWLNWLPIYNQKGEPYKAITENNQLDNKIMICYNVCGEFIDSR